MFAKNKKAFFSREQTCVSCHMLVKRASDNFKKLPAFMYFLERLGILITFTRKDFVILGMRVL